VLVEIYDPSPSRDSKIINISARSIVGVGENILLGGFALGGSGRKRLLIRAVGPQLAAFGVTDVLPDPVLELLDANGVMLAQNDDWDPALETTFAAAGAAPLAPGSRDAALTVSLTAGSSYSVVVRSRDGTTGEAMLEIFEVP
jgi:hypothetical protein